MSNLIGQSLGRYQILEQLGEGGMATVYKAFDARLERDVAIKIIRTDQFAPAVLERILKRFEREAKALARLTHPNIVGVIDYGEHEGAPYLVMPYLPGGTLKQYLGKPMPWQDAVHILLPVAQALEYAHEHNIIHRDIKPSNILLTEKGQPMLSDFGIAKILESDETATLTGTGVGVGTPEYMAPEQWTGHAGLQSDIYSLGVVFYELITGRKPYVADTPAAIQIRFLGRGNMYPICQMRWREYCSKRWRTRLKIGTMKWECLHLHWRTYRWDRVLRILYLSKSHSIEIQPWQLLSNPRVSITHRRRRNNHPNRINLYRE
jgi:serine/threonine protein kinase